MRRTALFTLLLALAAAPAFAAPAPMIRVRGFAPAEPVLTMMLGRGQTSGVTHAKKIVRVVSGDPTIVDYMRFQKAQPTIGLRAGRAGVTNLLVWTADMRVYTYLVTVR